MRPRRCLALLLLLAPSGEALSDPTECATIEEDKARLACFDRAFPGSAKPAGEPRGWRLASRPSALAGHTDRTATLDSSGTIKCRWTKERRVRMMVRCRNNITSVALESGCYMTSSRYRNYGDVTYSIDGGATAVSAMAASPDNNALGLWSGDSAIPFLKTLLGRRMLSVKMTPFADEPISTTFDLRGMGEAIAPVRQECGW